MGLDKLGVKECLKKRAFVEFERGMGGIRLLFYSFSDPIKLIKSINQTSNTVKKCAP